MASLNGKCAIVTGGSRGIGLSIARALADAGADVVISGTDQARLDAAHASLTAGRGDSLRVVAVRADVRDPAEAERLVGVAVDRFGGLDILINNAGLAVMRDVASMTIDEWRRVIDTNLSGVFYCCHAALPHMKARGAGWIVNISSLGARNTFVGGAAYCASKAGLNAFGEAMMQEVRHDGIRVTTVSPGSVRTAFSTGGDAPGTEWKLSPDDVARVVIDLLNHPARSLPSAVDIRPARPQKK
jgi:3-oxoacyl-[acyl-carrier protein] reductase